MNDVSGGMAEQIDDGNMVGVTMQHFRTIMGWATRFQGRRPAITTRKM